MISAIYETRNTQVRKIKAYEVLGYDKWNLSN